MTRTHTQKHTHTHSSNNRQLRIFIKHRCIEFESNSIGERKVIMEFHLFYSIESSVEKNENNQLVIV